MVLKRLFFNVLVPAVHLTVSGLGFRVAGFRV